MERIEFISTTQVCEDVEYVDVQMNPLSEIQLALIGGGCAEPSTY